MNFLNDIKTGRRIAIMLLFPVLSFLFFSGYTLLQKQNTYSEMSRVVELAHLAPTVSALVHEMQKERGVSAGFIGSKGSKFGDRVSGQRPQTDKALKDLTQALESFDASAFGSTLADKLGTATGSLGQLASSRSSVSSLGLSVPQMAKYYTGAIRQLLSIVEEITVLSTNAEVTGLLVAYSSFLHGKERAGVERAMGAAGFNAGKFVPAVHTRLIDLIGQQKAFFDTFTANAPADLVSTYKQNVQGGAVTEVQHMRDVAIAAGYGGDTQGIQGGAWFDTITQKIDLLKSVEDRIAAEVKSRAAAVQSAAFGLLMLFVPLTLAILAITVFLVVVIARGITGPIAGMVGAMNNLAHGDNEVEIPGIGRKDEIGEMADAVQIFKDNAIERVRLEAAQLEEQAAREERNQRVDGLIDGFNDEVGTILQVFASAAAGMEASANSMTTTAEQTNVRASTVAAASEEASTNVNTVASAAEELSSSISEISRQVTQSTQIASDAADKARLTNQQVEGLVSAAQKIGEVVSLIQDIAEQTNLLALNATIEAARAGEMGKGFTVVASEVKNLANQTAKATDEISQHISGIQGEITTSADSIAGIGKTIEEINDITASVAAAVEQQSAATQEIARNVQQASAGTKEVASNITGVSQAAGESGEAASQVLQATGELSRQSETLRGTVDKFLGEVKAA